MTVLAIAHRAGNSLSALQAACAVGVDVLEADVHMRGGLLEVRHHKSLGPLPWLWDRHGSRSYPWPGDRWDLVPAAGQLLLADLLEAAEGGATLMLDLKGVGRVGPAVVRALHERVPSAPVIVCARWWPSVDAFAGCEWARPVLSARGPRELARLRRRLASGRVPYGVSVHRSLLDRRLVEELRADVEVVMTWPVNDRQALAEVLRAGVNGVISDEPEILRAVVAG
ncbi:MAG: glycerophosphodiester phosphodiesterase [Frankiales bacterium]|nr:glycerophosphodiester phosphodiesterase [Frankiales bacterium]